MSSFQQKNERYTEIQVHGPLLAEMTGLISQVLQKWYPDDYNYEKHGWDISSKDTGHEAAYWMVLLPEEPDEFKLILPSTEDLLLMADTPESRLIQKLFLGQLQSQHFIVEIAQLALSVHKHYPAVL